MSTVTFASTHAAASGVSYPRTGGILVFADQPASLTMSYTYDAGIMGVVQGGTTTYTVPDLSARVDVPGYFRATVSPAIGTISWTGDTISFRATETAIPVHGNPPDIVIDVSFAGVDGLTAGSLPSSLAGLEGVPGAFHVQTFPSTAYRGDGGEVFGTAVAAPEPSSAILCLIGAVIALFTGIRRNRRARRREPVVPSPQPVR